MTPRAGLNANHLRVLLGARAHIDSLLAQMEQALLEDGGGRYVQDLAPAQRQHLRGRLAELRRTLDRGLLRLGLPPARPGPRASWSIESGLVAAEIDLEESAPDHLRSYGPVSPTAAAEASAVLDALTAELQRLRSAVSLARRPASPGPALTAPALQRKISGLARRVERSHLTALQPEVDALIERARADHIEVTLLGRVSAGKSSLLDALLDTRVLPVGVTPVSAVAVHLRRGAPAAATVDFVSGGREVLSPHHVEAFLTEALNPSNIKGVLRVEVQLPELPLPDWLTVVDTPGLGAAGASDDVGWRLARCELAVVLADASAGLGAEELELVRRAQASGVEVELLLGKADLLSAEERTRALEHARATLKTQLGLTLPVQWVSARGAPLEDARRWFQERILRRHASVDIWYRHALGLRVRALRASAAQALKGQRRPAHPAQRRSSG